MPEKIARKTRRRNEIIKAAAAVFAKTGFIKSTISEIATEAGIGKGTVYEYFSSKDDLFFAVFEDYWRHVAQKAVVNIKVLGQSAAQRLQAMNEAIMADWRQMIESFPLVMEFWAATASPLVKDRFKTVFEQGYTDFRQMVGAIIQDGIVRGEFKAEIDVTALAAALVGTWDALFLQAWFDSNFNPQHAARQFLPIFIAGMKV
jgi:AcrR family transcriptional regulator